MLSGQDEERLRLDPGRHFCFKLPLHLDSCNRSWVSGAVDLGFFLTPKFSIVLGELARQEENPAPRVIQKTEALF